MRVRVETTRCAGHARCHDVAGGLFELDDEGYALALDREVGPELHADALAGARVCPESAIVVTGA